jgi:hypothetical protein
MSILLGIDGTTDDVFWKDTMKYDDLFGDSFVSRICSPARPDRPTHNKAYIRGPLAFGDDLLPIIMEGYKFIHGKLWAGVDEPILLTGYSRGAAAVIDIAKRLQRENKSVKAMLLFDCVDRSPHVDSTRIPNNVGYVSLVMRLPETNSRAKFGYPEMRTDPPTRAEATMWHGTHAAMGGTPWPLTKGKLPSDYIVETPDISVEGGRVGFGGSVKFHQKTAVTYDQDARVSERIWSHAQVFLAKHGFQ